MKIGRALGWFQDGEESLTALNYRFFALGNLLTRLLNEHYNGRKIQFINIDFFSEKTFELYPGVRERNPHYYDKHLNFSGKIDFTSFNELNDEEQLLFIWKKAFEYLQTSSIAIKNDDLLKASQHAYNSGLAIKLNPDYRMIESDIVLYGQLFKAALWLHFKKEGMYSKLTLEKDGKLIFEKDIDHTRTGTEFFLVMYKGIEVKNNTIIIKARKDADGYPMKIFIDENQIK